MRKVWPYCDKISAMGQIVIDIPNKANRRYNIEKADEARQLLRALDGILNRDTPLNHQQIQDLQDGIRAERALVQMRRTEESYSVQQLREEFGLS
jgi:hypothetical protein